MTEKITSIIPSTDNLGEVVQTLASWQRDGNIVQLHPGDIGWYQRFGAEATASAIRLWNAGDQTVAIGLLESPELLRLALETMLKPEGCLEARSARILRDILTKTGWGIGDPWTSLKLELAEPVQQDILRIEIVGPAQVEDRVALQKTSFANSSFSKDKWHIGI